MDVPDSKQPKPFLAPPRDFFGVSCRELMTMTFEAGHEIIGAGLLKRGSILILGGPPKSYKSMIFNTMAFHLTTGTPLWGVTKKATNFGHKDIPTFPIKAQHKVLLMEQEVGFEDQQARLKMLISALPEEQRDLVYDNLSIVSCERSLHLNDTGGINAIHRTIDHWRPDVVILDPLVEFHWMDENRADSMRVVFKNLDSLRSRWPRVAWMISHHTSKPSEVVRSGPDLLRGSSALFAKGDTFIIAKPSRKEPGKVNLSFTLRRGKPISDFDILISDKDLNVLFLGWNVGRPKEADSFA